MQLNRDSIETALDASRQAVESALLAVYERQTIEKRMPATHPLRSGIAFADTDTPYIAELYAQLQRGKSLLPGQLQIARRKMKANWQLLVELDQAPEIPDAVKQHLTAPVQFQQTCAAMPEFATW